MRVCIIDCEDSYTLNIADYLRTCGAAVDIIPYDHIGSEPNLLTYNGIVFSPGPKKPNDVPILFDLIDRYKSQIPLLGICLGHQVIGAYFGHEIIRSQFPMHGVPVIIQKMGDMIFEGIENPFYAMRYNSLTVSQKEDSDLNIICRDPFHDIMGFRHKKFPIYSFQFHPESVGCPQGIKIMRNWISNLPRSF